MTYERNRALGRYGERVAADHLRSLGMVVLARNWRCRFGEIDLVARDGSTLVICEVKTRTGILARHAGRGGGRAQGHPAAPARGVLARGPRRRAARPCASTSCRSSCRRAALRTSSASPGSPDGGHPRGRRSTASPGGRSRSRSTSAAACRRPSSSGSPTRSSTRRATGSGRRWSTPARRGPTSASRSTWRRPTLPKTRLALRPRDRVWRCSRPSG